MPIKFDNSNRELDCIADLKYLEYDDPEIAIFKF